MCRARASCSSGDCCKLCLQRTDLCGLWRVWMFGRLWSFGDMGLVSWGLNQGLRASSVVVSSTVVLWLMWDCGFEIDGDCGERLWCYSVWIQNRLCGAFLTSFQVLGCDRNWLRSLCVLRPNVVVVLSNTVMSWCAGWINLWIGFWCIMWWFWWLWILIVLAGFFGIFGPFLWLQVLAL